MENYSVKVYIGGVLIREDITERKQAEKLLQELNATLERRVTERTQLAESRAKQLQALAMELAFQQGPLLLAAEYLMTDIRRDGGPDLRFDGYHAEISYVLTGESRGYGDGVFGGLRPKNSTLGAWEAAARWSSIDLRDKDIAGGKQENLTLGINWYATDSIRFMANVIFVDATESPSANEEDDSPTIYLLRAQYRF